MFDFKKAIITKSIHICRILVIVRERKHRWFRSRKLVKTSDIVGRALAVYLDSL